MNLRVETVEEKQRILIVAKKKYPFIEILRRELEQYGNEIFFSPYPPKNLTPFDYCFDIEDNRWIVTHLKKHGHPKKTIEITGNDIRKEHIDTILWFSFSEAREKRLQLTVPVRAKPEKRYFFFTKIDFKKFCTKKNVIIGGIVIFIIIHTAFLLPLSISLYSSYRSFSALKRNDNIRAKNFLGASTGSLSLTKSLYGVARPVLLFFSVALPFDTAIDIDDKTNTILTQSLLLSDNINEVQKLVFKKNKSKEERAYLILRLEKLKQEVETVSDNLNILADKIPYRLGPFMNIANGIRDAADAIIKIKKLLPYTDSLLAAGTEKKYLLFFANNMEIRPGGGFLGSFGIVRVKDYTIETIEIHDVYDADGQLTAHIEPPAPIKKYLNNAHWFLRDSDFSPDFPTNYDIAKMFLSKEIQETDFSGAALLTTTAIEHILDAFGDVYVPDFNETINQKNFYLKAQVHSETDFFPGSIQKKSFLSALTNQLLINLDSASPKRLALAFKKSLDEKQIVLFSEEKDMQDIVDSLYWSGRTLQPRCITEGQTNCIVDYIFPFDANLGVNKVNFFVTRSMYLKTSIRVDGQIRHVFSIQFQNDSPAAVFPGGTYKNYFQTMLPSDSRVTRITKDGEMVEDHDESTGRFKTVGLYFELLPKKTTEIKIEYVLTDQLQKGKGIYQLIAQKQIGSSNNDYVFELDLPANMSIDNQNFSPLVKDNHIVYNTSLSQDKIFFIQLNTK